MKNEEMENNNVEMCQFWQSLRQRDKRKEKKAQSNLYTMHAKCVITIPKNVHTHGETHDEL